MASFHIRVYAHRNMHGLMRHDTHRTVGIVEEPWGVVEREADASHRLLDLIVVGVGQDRRFVALANR